MHVPTIMFEYKEKTVSLVKSRTGSSVPEKPKRRLNTNTTSQPSPTHHEDNHDPFHEHGDRQPIDKNCSETISRAAPHSRVFARTTDIVRGHIQEGKFGQFANGVEKACETPTPNNQSINSDHQSQSYITKRVKNLRTHASMNSKH
jgi:hypothetical protein